MPASAIRVAAVSLIRHRVTTEMALVEKQRGGFSGQTADFPFIAAWTAYSFPTKPKMERD
jgi:hypothetical protein